MKGPKSPIGGREITRREALKGLGDPKTWPQYAAKVYAEFRAKPKPKTQLLKQAVKAISKLLPKGTSESHLLPVYAKSVRKRARKKAVRKSFKRSKKRRTR